MTSPLDLTVVIPAYREADNLRLLLPRLIRVLDGMGLRYEVLIVDTDPSKDETPDVCREWPVKRVPRVGGDYYGDAVRTGIRASAGRYILFMDADGSHAPEFVPKLWDKHHENDVVIASRYIAGGDTENSWPLILMSRVLNVVYAVTLGLNCRDVSNSFKLYRADLLQPLSLRCQHFDVVEEMLVLARVNNPLLRICEVPFVFKKRLFGETKRSLFIFILAFHVTLVKLMILRMLSRRKA